MSPKAFSVACVTLILVVVGCVGLFNRIVDPYGYFRDVEIVGFNVNKPKVVGNERLVKPAWVAKLKPQAVIVGNSVAEIGLPPTHRGFTKDGALIAFNMGMPGAAWRDTYCFAMFAMRRHPCSGWLGVSGTDEEVCPPMRPRSGGLRQTSVLAVRLRCVARCRPAAPNGVDDSRLWYFHRYDALCDR
jgi:hypothetical protein